jgi:hypothetical protein
VAISTIINGSDTITLGLQAQPRYENPALTESGGVYSATPGENYGNPADPLTYGDPSHYLGSTWDFDFYIGVSGSTAALSDYTYVLSYGTDAASLIGINPLAISDNKTTATTAQNGENLLFGDFGGVPNTLIFDPNASGVYSFELAAYQGSTLVGETAIDVDVHAAPDAASSALLLGLGVLPLMAFGFRQRRTQSAK